MNPHNEEELFKIFKRNLLVRKRLIISYLLGVSAFLILPKSMKLTLLQIYYDYIGSKVMIIDDNNYYLTIVKKINKVKL